MGTGTGIDAGTLVVAAGVAAAVVVAGYEKAVPVLGAGAGMDAGTLLLVARVASAVAACE